MGTSWGQAKLLYQPISTLPACVTEQRWVVKGWPSQFGFRRSASHPGGGLDLPSSTRGLRLWIHSGCPRGCHFLTVEDHGEERPGHCTRHFCSPSTGQMWACGCISCEEGWARPPAGLVLTLKGRREKGYRVTTGGLYKI